MKHEARFIIDNPPKDKDGFNVVTDKEIAAFENNVQFKAAQFMRKYVKYDPRTNRVDYSIKLHGFSYDDICQELRIATWVALKNYNKERVQTENGVMQKSTYVFNCMDGRLSMLHRNIWGKNRGFAQSHNYDSIILRGEYEEYE